MTELATRPMNGMNGWGVLDHPAQPEPAPARQDLAEWVDQARQVAGIAEMLAVTSFVPKAFRGKPAETAAAILAGQEVGLSPMASLRAIDVIEGKPGMSALALRALVQSHGHEIWVHESTATRAIVKGRRKGSDRVETSTWTLDRARQMGLAGKDNWRKQPTAMLLARATSECARLVAADVLLGMPYSVEELADGADASAPVSSPPSEAKPPRRTARRAQPAAPVVVPEPELSEPTPQWSEPTGPVEPDPEPERTAEPGITDAQITKLHTAFTGAGVKDRDQKIALIEQVTGRRVGSSKELTMREAARVIDHLEQMAAEPLRVEESVVVADDEPGFDWPEVAQPGGDR